MPWGLGDVFGGSKVCYGSDCDVYVLSELWRALSSVLDWDIVRGLIVLMMVFSLLRYVLVVVARRS